MDPPLERAGLTKLSLGSVGSPPNAFVENPRPRPSICRTFHPLCHSTPRATRLCRIQLRDLRRLQASSAALTDNDEQGRGPSLRRGIGRQREVKLGACDDSLRMAINVG